MDSITGTLGTEDFLQLFVTQLQYQDPLNPLDSSEFTAQLAQFSSLEQLYNIDSTLQSILSYQNSLNNAMATSLIGRAVKIDGNTFSLESTADLNYTLHNDASSVTITIYDSEGNAVKTIELGAQSTGDQSFYWDGTDDNGVALPDDTYSFTVTAMDENEDSVEVSTLTMGVVMGVSFEDGITYLMLDNGMNITLGEITEIYEQGGA